MKRLAAAFGAVFAVTAAYRWLHITNTTTVALSYLLVVLITATVTSRLRIGVTTSIASMLCLNFFFLPPVGRFTIAEPQNWVALFTFLTVSLVATRLSSLAHLRQQDAAARRDELARLFDLSRDILLTTETAEATRQLTRCVARRFELEYAAICLPRDDTWEVFADGTIDVDLEPHELARAFAGVSRGLEFDARLRTYAGHRTIDASGVTVHLVPLRLGTKAVGLLAAAGRPIEPGTLDALAGIVAIAIERGQLLEDRKAAEVARRSEELKSALLASLGHDLRTPLTAIRVAASNLRAAWLDEGARREQSELILAEVERLTRLFQNILEMARIDAGAVSTEPRWVHPSEVVDAARAQVEHIVGAHPMRVSIDTGDWVRLDPRLTAAAVAHIIENAAQYSPDGAPIDVGVSVGRDGLRVTVRDRGPGIAAADLPRLFERFYRGATAKGRVSGTGMGLAIARGLLAAEQGQVWAQNCADGGARFTIVVPAEHKTVEQPA